MTCLCCGKAGERAAWSEKCPEAYVCIDCKSLPARFDKLRNDANESNRLIAATAERADARAKELEAENARLKKDVDQARELAMIRHCDVNANGKTILDFHEVWLRQANTRVVKAEAERDDALRSSGYDYNRELRASLAQATGLLKSATDERDALRADAERLRDALERLISYNEDIHAGRINYRPLDHIAVARRAINAARKEKPCDCVRPEIHGHQLLCKQGKAR